MKLLIVVLALAGLAVAQDPPPPAAPVLTWVKPGPIRNPAPLTVGQLNATVNAPGEIVYDPPAGTVLDAGTHTLTATFTPADAAAYTTATATVSLEVLSTYWPYEPGEHYVCDMQPDLSAPAVDEAGAPRCFVVPLPVSEAFVKHLITQTAGLKPDGTPAFRYANWWDYIVKYFVTSLVLPMLDQYPTAEVLEARASAQAATEAVDAAKAAAIGVDAAALKDGAPISQPALRATLPHPAQP